MATCLRTAVLAALLGGLGACQTQTAGTTTLAATVTPQPTGMEGDIRRILTQGGLNASAPGSLQTAKMPTEVQQAVAALQGGAADPLPFGGSAAPTQVGVQSMPQTGGSSIALLPTASAGVPPNALALAPEMPAASPFPGTGGQPPLLAALAQTQAAHARTSPRRVQVPMLRQVASATPAKRIPFASATQTAGLGASALNLVAVPTGPVAAAPVAALQPPPAPKAPEPPPVRRF